MRDEVPVDFAGVYRLKSRLSYRIAFIFCYWDLK
jgi:hypothetical protein